MNYEKKYKEALERARKSYVNSIEQGWTCDKVIYEEIFPELKESKDEKIRKELLSYLEERRVVETLTDTPVKEEWLSWLEKQKDINALIQEAYEKAYTEGIRVERKHWLEKQGKQEYALKSSKDEDVRNFMQQIKKEAKAYEFNLSNRDYDIYAFAKDILAWLEKQGEQKPWSEEDSEWYMVVKESILERWKGTDNKDLIELRDDALNWFKSLKDRVWPQPKQE